MKKRERRNQSTGLFVPSSSCGPVEPTETALRASICPDDLRKDPHHPGTFATSLRCGAAPTLSAALAIVVPAPKRAPAHAGTLSNRISATGISWYAGTLRNIRADRRNNQKNFRADYPRCLAGLFFPVPHALAVALALGLPLFLTRRRGPVLLLCFPLGPLPRLLSTPGTAVALRGLLRMKGLLTSLQQTHPRPRPTCWMHASGCLLIFGSVCRTFRKAHGRYSSQKLMPRRGTSNSSPGRSSSVRSPTAISDKLQSAQTHSISTHFKTGRLTIFALHHRDRALAVRPTLVPHNGPVASRR
jgi:hypothetical protein